MVLATRVAGDGIMLVHRGYGGWIAREADAGAVDLGGGGDQVVVIVQLVVLHEAEHGLIAGKNQKYESVFENNFL